MSLKRLVSVRMLTILIIYAPGSLWCQLFVPESKDTYVNILFFLK